jgi:acetyltransferase-like isoleucine patch superfamily enzyme
MGSDCLIASGCKFIDHDLSRRDLLVAPQVEGAETAIFLEEDVWLGANVIVLKGTRIARGAVLAACSVVTIMRHRTKCGRACPLEKLASGLLSLNLSH